MTHSWFPQPQVLGGRRGTRGRPGPNDRGRLAGWSGGDERSIRLRPLVQRPPSHRDAQRTKRKGQPLRQAGGDPRRGPARSACLACSDPHSGSADRREIGAGSTRSSGGRKRKLAFRLPDGSGRQEPRPYPGRPARTSPADEDPR